jgi:hypothetical protein
MRLRPILSILVPVIGLTMLGARAIGRKWRTMREVTQLRGLGKAPRRRLRSARR